MMNRIRNLDSFYVEIESHLRLVGAYMGNDRLPFLFKMCRLKPYGIVFKAEKKAVRLHKRWVDEWGNTLRLGTVHGFKSLHFDYEDEKLEPKKLVCTDLYHCLSLDKMIKMSKIIYLLVGKDESEKDHAIIAMLGIDNFLRVFALLEGHWQMVAPLRLGKYVLELIVRNQSSLQGIKQIDRKNKVIRACLNQHAWLCSWAPQSQFVEIIKSYPFLMDALKVKESNGKK